MIAETATQSTASTERLQSGRECLFAVQHRLEQVTVLRHSIERDRIEKSRGRTSSVSSSQRSGVETGAPGLGRTE